jgi:hypothetical protein
VAQINLSDVRDFLLKRAELNDGHSHRVADPNVAEYYRTRARCFRDAAAEVSDGTFEEWQEKRNGE